MEIMENKLISTFLNQLDNHELYTNYQENNLTSTKEQLDERFQIFYLRYRLISYLIKVLHFESKHFDRKLREYNRRYQLSTNDYDLEQILYDLPSTEDRNNDAHLDIQDHLTDKDLFYSVSRLTDRQKKILTLTYVQQMTDTEAAKHLGVSQQTISKTRNGVINKLRSGGRYKC